MQQTKSLQRLALALPVCCLLTQTASALVTTDSVYVGNIGNAADPTTGYGAVNYGYSIGKYEVSLNQYTEFLNAVAKTDTYGLYNTSMGTDLNIAGISRSGASGSYTYSVIGSGNRPVTYVSWYDSARFVNWLHNGQPTGLQTASTTERGAYTMTSNTGFPARNSGWKYGLPSENEWYKAAFHQPAAQGGDADDYWLYPTANNSIPNSRNGSLSDPNSANIYRNDGIANGFNDGFATGGSSGYLTDVGAFSIADSFYGTFDQGGNVQEWNGTIIGSFVQYRGVRGGAFSSLFGQPLPGLLATERQQVDPIKEFGNLGFRVVIVPEPSTAGLLGLGALLMFSKRK